VGFIVMSLCNSKHVRIEFIYWLAAKLLIGNSAGLRWTEGTI